MKKIKVLFLQTHFMGRSGTVVHGVDYARVINPANALKKHPDFEVEERNDPIKGTKFKDWDEVTKHYDIIYTSYIDFPTGYVHMALFSKKNGTVYITDVDDNLWEIPDHSPTKKHYHPGSERLDFVSLALEDTPYVTTTNLFLKYRLVKYLRKPHEKIKVLPNFIDLSVYDYKKIPKKTNTDEIVITYFGTNTHTKDVIGTPFWEGLQRVVKEFPNVYFQTTGFFLPQAKTRLKKFYRWNSGQMNFSDWLKTWGEIMSDGDIVVAPLEDTDFNKCKSAIKFLEYAAAKRPGVYQDIRQYQEMVKMHNGVPTGLLARSGDDWYKKLKLLVEDAALRREIGESAYDFVKEKWTMDGNVNLYADYFKEIYEHHQKFGNLENAGFVMPGSEVIRNVN